MKINAGDQELRGQVARGAVGPTMQNISPAPPGMSPRGFGMGGNAGLGANPSRTGAPPAGRGSYQQITGSPSPGAAAVTPGSVPNAALGGASKARDAMLAHGRVLGGIAAMRQVHGDHPHLKAMHAKSTAHINAYRGGGVKSFGALGGASGGSGIPNKAGAMRGGMPPAGGEADDGY